MLAVIDYGAGNLRSVVHALHHLGVKDMRLVHEPADLEGAHQIILPGVGAAGAGMRRLDEAGLVPELQVLTQPSLGVSTIQNVKYCLSARNPNSSSERCSSLSAATPYSAAPVRIRRATRNSWML